MAELIAESDEFKVFYEDCDNVTILDGEGSVRLTMPFDVWTELMASFYKWYKL